MNNQIFPTKYQLHLVAIEQQNYQIA